jgi:hypothetical protein
MVEILRLHTGNRAAKSVQSQGYRTKILVSSGSPSQLLITGGSAVNDLFPNKNTGIGPNPVILPKAASDWIER